MDGPRKKHSVTKPGGNPCGEVKLGDPEACKLVEPMRFEWKDDHDGRASEIDFRSVRLVVHHYVGYPPDLWLLSVYGLREKVPLQSKTLVLAKVEALAWLRGYLSYLLRDVIWAEEHPPKA